MANYFSRPLWEETEENEVFKAFVYNSLERHYNHDWGDVDEDDKMENELALETKNRLLSVYRYSEDVKIWIITDPEWETTTVLFPEDY
jgi:hypothetical protein